jgi:CRP-like cAMP-binding protein
METREDNLRRTRRRLAAEREAASRGQAGLFEDPEPRRVVPVTSSQDLLEVSRAGIRAGQKRRLLEVLRGLPEPVTSYELAEAAGMDRYTPGRRLSEMELDGSVRRRGSRPCRITGRIGILWEAV